ncbi:MAG: hypothetical protein QOJ57_1726, partial [Thermoleophilaceae bacterium]|nr:hypothetical protein [Thermoleophilaceae bacterium]
RYQENFSGTSYVNEAGGGEGIVGSAGQVTNAQGTTIGGQGAIGFGAESSLPGPPIYASHGQSNTTPTPLMNLLGPVTYQVQNGELVIVK